MTLDELKEDNAFQALTITTLEQENEALKLQAENLAKNLWMIRYESAAAWGTLESAREWANKVAESEL
jgi:hypothetical protein